MDIVSPDDRHPRLIVCSDLDGCLLDKEDYSCDAALPILQRLNAKDIPLIFCTSKTLAEVLPIRDQLKNHDPFIVENGGAVYIPTGYFPGQFDCDRSADDYLVFELGTPYRDLVDALDRLKHETGVPLRGFSDMTASEISTLCKLTLLQADQAKAREWDEPFLILDPATVDSVISAAEVPVTHGGRFYHLTTSDKGRAVSIVIELMRRFWGDVTSVGIGNGPNDIPMFNAVTIPIMVGTGASGADWGGDLRHVLRFDDAGPEGWKFAVTALLDRHISALAN